MSGEPTLTDAQREQWAYAVDAAKGRIDPRYPNLDTWDRATIAVNERLTWLESSRARLVEENRRLAADRDHWKEHAEKEEESANRLSIDRNRYSRLVDALTGYIPRDLWWPEAEMSWFDALCAALGILKPDRVDAALTSPEAGREEGGGE